MSIMIALADNAREQNLESNLDIIQNYEKKLKC